MYIYDKYVVYKLYQIRALLANINVSIFNFLLYRIHNFKAHCCILFLLY